MRGEKWEWGLVYGMKWVMGNDGCIVFFLFSGMDFGFWDIFFSGLLFVRFVDTIISSWPSILAD